jgi:hypothetical protein
MRKHRAVKAWRDSVEKLIGNNAELELAETHLMCSEVEAFRWEVMVKAREALLKRPYPSGGG